MKGESTVDSKNRLAAGSTPSVQKPLDTLKMPELAPTPNLHANDREGGGLGHSPRKPMNLDDFPEDCSGYGIDAKPRGRRYYLSR